MKKVLFVDDDQNIRNGLKRTLRSMSLEWIVDFAESGSQALELMAQNGYDAIVCDMRMPGMSGIDILKTVNDNYPETIRFVLSGMVDHDTSLQVSKYAHQFFSKPCEAKVLVDALQRAFSLETGQSLENLRKVFAKMKKFPSLPSLYLNITEEIRSPNASLDKIGAIIERDPSMCAKVLQLVNSAFFGMKQNIVDPFQATTFLGVDVIRGLVLSTGVFSQFSPPLLKRLGLGALWDHSMLVGIYAKTIAKMENQSNTIQGYAYTAGLLHDVGKMVLAENLPLKYSSAIGKSINNQLNLYEAELDIFGVTHAQVGAYLLGVWGVSDEVVKAIEFHHRTAVDGSPVSLAAIAVYAANIIDHQIHMRNWAKKKPEINLSYLEYSGLKNQYPRWMESCRSISE